MKRFVVSVAIALMLLGTITSVAAEPKTIPGWVELRQDMELLKGALDGTVAQHSPEHLSPRVRCGVSVFGEVRDGSG